MNVASLAEKSIEYFGEYEALHFAGASHTNVERWLAAKRLAAMLRERGVRKGDQVVVMMPNGPEVLAAFPAIWALGAVVVPIGPQASAAEAQYLVEDSEAKLVLTQSELAARLRAPVAGKTLTTPLLDFDDEELQREWERIDPVTHVESRAEEDLAVLLYTSGTTGKPKGVMLTHGNMVSNARAVATTRPIPPKTRVLLILPLSHSFGIMTMNVGYVQGTECTILPRFEPRRVFEAIDRWSIQRFSVVPTMLTQLIHHPDRGQFDLSSLEVVHSGGSALANEIRVEFERLFRCRVTEGYGLSECAPTAACYGEGEPYRPGSVGRAIDGVTVRVIDLAGSPVNARCEGEICIQGPNVMLGYWKNSAATRDAIQEGWLRTGDLGFIDEDGYLFITGRRKDLIIKGGENISPREIEEVIQSHPAVKEVAVVGFPDPLYGENIAAFLVLREGAKAEGTEIQAHVAASLTKFKIPAEILFRDALPKTPVGKILKRALREEVAGEASVKSRSPSP
ncbi:MAG: AMP-binding protein [Planctomycetota bacterium]